tara:strand:+ start:909 stop:2555 length:1647 start_codon:yes stop_codon:yes gene_type:complete
MPKSYRIFEGNPYARLLTSFSKLDRSYSSRLSKYADGLRKKGINARIVRNKKSTSLYVRPRKYNAPIPAITEKEAVLFPSVATKMLMGQNADIYGFSEKTKMALRREINDAMNPIGTIGGMPPISELKERYDISQDDIISQGQELKEFFEGIAEIEKELLADNDIKLEVGLQEIDDIEYKKANGQFSSNLKESQWFTIENDDRIKGVFSSPEYNQLKEKYFLKALVAYAQKKGDLSLEYNLGTLNVENADVRFVRADPQKSNSNWYFFVDGKVKYTISNDVVEVMKEEVEYDVKDYWREFFVAAIRQIGGTEHEAYLEAKGLRNVNDLQDEIEKLNFNQWDKWSLNLYDTPKEVVERVIPSMIDLPELPEVVENTSEKEIDELANLSKEWATEITIKTNDASELVSRLFNNLNTPTKSNEVITIKDLKPLEKGERGGLFADVGGSKVYLDKRLLKTYSRKSWTQPRITHRKYNRARTKIAEFVYDEMKKGNQPNTIQIQDHLNDSMRSPPVIEQVGNWLARDPRFVDVGFDKWPSRVKKWELTPPKRR